MFRIQCSFLHVKPEINPFLITCYSLAIKNIYTKKEKEKKKSSPSPLARIASHLSLSFYEHLEIEHASLLYADSMSKHLQQFFSLATACRLILSWSDWNVQVATYRHAAKKQAGKMLGGINTSRHDIHHIHCCWCFLVCLWMCCCLMLPRKIK